MSADEPSGVDPRTAAAHAYERTRYQSCGHPEPRPETSLPPTPHRPSLVSDCSSGFVWTGTQAACEREAIRLPTLSFIGHSTCGKDEAGQWLAAHTPLRFVHTTSWYLAPFVAKRTGLPVETFRGPDRHEHAETMFQVGHALRDDDPGVLIRLAREENDIISGVRDPEEVDYLREQGLIDLVVWLDRDVPEDPTMRRFGPRPWTHADIRLDNTGDLPAFYARLARLAKALGIPVTS